MGSEWPILRLDEITDLIIDCPHSTPKWTEIGVVVLRSQYIKNGRLNLTNPSFTTEIGYQARVKRAVPTAGDIVLTREAPMGEVCMVPKNLKCCLGQRMVLLRVNNDILDSEYLLYVLQSPFLQHQISWNEGTGTTVSNIRIPSIKAFQIPMPDLSVQKRIAQILSALDNKIELNRQTNQTLEQMAQALFKSWFVDFDPVIDNALAAGNPIPDELQERAQRRQQQLAKPDHKPLPDDIRQLFPSEFELTEALVGWVPKGWKVSNIPEGAEFQEGPGILAKDFHDEGIPLIRLAGMKNGVSLLDGCNFLDPEKVNKKWNHFRLQKGDILLSSSASLGRVSEVDSGSVGAIAYTGIISFRPIKKVTNHRYILHFLKSSFFQQQVTMMGVGSVLNHFGPTHIKKMLMLIPRERVLEKFSEIITPYDTAINNRLRESASLSNVRNTLLPKLISGELRLPSEVLADVEQQPVNAIVYNTDRI